MTPLNELTPELQKLQADLQTHHIEGIAREGNTEFSCPLITHVEGNLWQGGCVNAVDLQGQFKHIISLYPWERYNPGKMLDSFTEVKLYDGKDVPDEAQLYSLAMWINICKRHGRTLVHCQAGLNRSGLLTGLSLISDDMDPEFYKQPAKVIAHMRERRSKAVLCNKHFEQWLLART